MNFLWIAAPLLISVSGPCQEGSWPAFLGAGADKVDPATLPLKWSPEKNIAWKVPIPGQGQSAPIIWKDRVYVTSVEGIMRDTCHVLALSLKDGSVLWDHKIPSSTKARSTRTQSRAAPTPSADQDGIYVFFETGDVAAISHQGKEIWKRSLVKEIGKFESTIGLAASPLMVGENLVLLVDHEGPSYLLAMAKKDGKTVWKTDRESRSSYTSPSLIPMGNGQHIICSSSGSVDGYDPVTGEQLWSYEEVGGNNVCSPFPAGDGRFLVGAQAGMHNEKEKEAKQSNLVMEVTRGPDGKFQPKVLWKAPMLTSFANPICHQGTTYWMSKTGNVGAYESLTGKELWSARVKDPCWAAPVSLGDRIYFFGKDGLTTVIQSGPHFKVLAENRLWLADPSTPPDSARSSRSGGGAAPSGRPVSPAGAPAAEGAKPENKNPGTPRASGSNMDAPGRPIFQDPVQYGVAIVNGSLVVRTGSQVFCLREQK